LIFELNQLNLNILTL